MKATLLIVFLSFSIAAQSQAIKRSSIGAVGNSFENNSIKLNQSVGQNSVHDKIENTEIILRQGFQQPERKSSNKASNLIDIHVFPNPNEGEFTALIGIDRNEEFNFTLTDSQGRIIMNDSKINTVENNFSVHNATQKGTYILRIVTKSGKFGQAKLIII